MMMITSIKNDDDDDENEVHANGEGPIAYAFFVKYVIHCVQTRIVRRTRSADDDDNT